jgi:hypothetical protein
VILLESEAMSAEVEEEADVKLIEVDEAVDVEDPAAVLVLEMAVAEVTGLLAAAWYRLGAATGAVWRYSSLSAP